MRAAGLTQVQARCVECDRETDIPISALDLPEGTLLSDVSSLRPIACHLCSGPAVPIMPSVDGKALED